MQHLVISGIVHALDAHKVDILDAAFALEHDLFAQIFRSQGTVGIDGRLAEYARDVAHQRHVAQHTLDKPALIPGRFKFCIVKHILAYAEQAVRDSLPYLQDIYAVATVTVMHHHDAVLHAFDGSVPHETSDALAGEIHPRLAQRKLIFVQTGGISFDDGPQRFAAETTRDDRTVSAGKLSEAIVAEAALNIAFIIALAQIIVPDHRGDAKFFKLIHMLFDIGYKLRGYRIAPAHRLVIDVTADVPALVEGITRSIEAFGMSEREADSHDGKTLFIEDFFDLGNVFEGRPAGDIEGGRKNPFYMAVPDHFHPSGSLRSFDDGTEPGTCPDFHVILLLSFLVRI